MATETIRLWQNSGTPSADQLVVVKPAQQIVTMIVDVDQFLFWTPRCTVASRRVSDACNNKKGKKP